MKSTRVKYEMWSSGESTPTGDVVKVCTAAMPEYSDQLRALHILRQNVKAILHSQGASASLLAQHLGFKSRSSVTKFLNDDRTGFEMDKLDRLASFCGFPVYKLFQPGLSRATERRKGQERRSGVERRIGHVGRVVRGLQSEVNKLPRLASARGMDYGPGAVPPAVAALVTAIMAKAEQEIAAVYEAYAADIRRQTASTRRKISGSSKSRRSPSGSDPETA